MKTEYKIIELFGSRSVFQDMVNISLNDGWSLQGGVSYSVIPGVGSFYAQALTRQVPDEKPKAKEPAKK